MLDPGMTVEGDIERVGDDVVIQSLYELDVVAMCLRCLVKNLRRFQHERDRDEMLAKLTRYNRVPILSRPHLRLRGRFDTILGICMHYVFDSVGSSLIRSSKSQPYTGIF